jgi:hypothetical protein
MIKNSLKTILVLACCLCTTPCFGDALNVFRPKEGDVYDFMLFIQSFNLLQENLNLLE